MSIDSLKSLLNDFNPSSFIPSLDSLLTHLAPLVRVAVLVGPVCLLVFGLIYLFLPPKEANYSLGFRCRRGMASVEAWQFTQFVAGVIWILLGLGLGIWALVSYRRAADMEQMELLFKAIHTILWEICLTIAGAICVNIAVIVFFDFRGNRRPSSKKKREKSKKKAK